jgi:hypothetical protein
MFLRSATSVPDVRLRSIVVWFDTFCVKFITGLSDAALEDSQGLLHGRVVIYDLIHALELNQRRKINITSSISVY